MDPVSLGILGALFVGLLVLTIVFWLIRAWVRSMVRMAKFAVYGGFTLVLLTGIAAAVAWMLYGEQIRVTLGL